MRTPPALVVSCVSILAGVFAYAETAHAAIYINIPFDGTITTGGGDNPSYGNGLGDGSPLNSQMGQNLGTGLSAVIESATIGFDRFIGGTAVGELVLYCFIDAGYSVPCTTGSMTATSSPFSTTQTGSFPITGTFSPVYVMEPLRYYRLALNLRGSCASLTLGCYWQSRTATSGIPPAMIQATSTIIGDTWTKFGANVANVQVFSLSTADPPYIEPTHPTPSEAFDTHLNAVFRGVYDRGCFFSDWTHAHFVFSHVDTGSTTSRYLPLNLCGAAVYNYAFSAEILPYAGAYTYRVRLTQNAPPLVWNPIGTPFSASSTFSITFPPPAAGPSGLLSGESLLSGSMLYDPAFDSYFQQVAIEGGILGSTTATSTGQLFSALGALQAARGIAGGKFPFNWVFEAGDAISASLAATSSVELELEMDFGAASSTAGVFGNTKITLFSPTTIQQFMPPGFAAGLRTLMGAVLWISAAGYVIRRTQSMLA